MDTEFKLGFLANQAARTETNSATDFKSNGSEGSKSFESTLNDKRNEIRSEKNNNNANKSGDARRKVRTEAKTTETAVAQRTEKDEGSAARKTGEAEKSTVQEKRRSEVKEEKKASKGVDGKNETIVAENPAALSIPDETAEAIISQIAETLGVAPEQVTEALENLNMSIGELTEPVNVKQLIMEIEGITDAAELLKVPELTEKLRKITATASEALQAQAEKAVEMPTANGDTMQLRETSEVTVNQPEIMTRGAIASQEAALISDVKTDTDLADNISEAGETEHSVNEVAAASGNTAQRSGNEAQSGSGGNEEKPLGTDNNDQTTVVIQKADETVVEVGGRTVSRVLARPQTQATEVLNQIADKMRLEFKPGATELKINLRPDELGSVTVKIVTESGHVTAEIVTENSKVKELVEENLSALRESLKQQGIDVGELSVSVGQQETDERMKQFMNGQTKSHARMSQIINKVTGEEVSLEPVNYANEAEVNGNTIDFSA